MKKVYFFIAILLLSGLFAFSQPELSWRFANTAIVSGGTQLQFDIEVKADASGSFHRDLQIYFDYNTAGFGNDIVAGTGISYSLLPLMDNHYTVVNMVDNTSSKVAIITEGLNEGPTGGQPGSATYFNEITTAYQGVLQITMDISTNTELAGIGFDQALMGSGQYYQSTTTTDPVKYVEPSIFENDLTGFDLFSLRLDVTAFLEGPYSGAGNMNTSLLAGGYIPTVQPYDPVIPYYGNSNPVWQYGGTESVGSVPAGAVDWVLVQLRDADVADNATSATILATQAGFLLSDGSVVGLDGVSILAFPGITLANNLYVVIYHRNHLGIMSANAVTETAGIHSYDFSTGVSQVYGGINGHKEIETGVWGLVSADGNGNGLVQNTDEVNVWKVDLGGSGYDAGDFNLNGLTQNTDEVNYWKPNLGGGGQIPLTDANTGYESQIPK